uniref:Uncharacterized protein LOC111117861 isoform X5 n=1 Tax=Crassostrea virginica TaxID=6565 RepID=A0A8B8CAX0_CRAVI|nr:uncharacterized protein LOC111117861 isoform X5 [Crassostrea virginica]XP_022312801.1 uncharacterized protein LOC111117861 isoform X6 [Crassostrea virginica]
MLGRAFILVVLGLILNARGEDSCRPATICCEESPRRCGGVCECIRFSQLMTRERVLRVQFAPGTHLVYADRVLVEAVGDPVPRIIHTSDVSSDAPTMQTQSKSSIQATVDTTPTMPTRSKSTIASLPNPGKTTQTTDFSTAGKTLRVLMPMNMTPIVIISTVSVVVLLVVYRMRMTEEEAAEPPQEEGGVGIVGIRGCRIRCTLIECSVRTCNGVAGVKILLIRGGWWV